MVAIELGRKAILIELNPEYAKMIRQRTDVTPGLPI
jgi:DNA modification methylase